MKKRILSVFLALVLVVSLAAFAACAAEEEPPVVEEEPPVVEEEPPVVEEEPPVVEEPPPVVEEEPPVVEEPLPEGALPPIELSFINADFGWLLLKQETDLAPYGYPGEVNLPAPWTITIPKGSTITVTIGVSGHPESGTHHIIIEGTDIDVTLGVGETIGAKELTFNEVGTFKVYSDAMPAESECFIEVTEAAPVEEEPAAEVGALPPIELSFINADFGWLLLKQETDLAPYGYPGEVNLPAPWTITIPKGSTITVTIGVSGHPESGTHHIIIEGTDVDATLRVGEKLGTKELTFNESGTFKVYSESLPAELECTIVVTESMPH